MKNGKIRYLFLQKQILCKVFKTIPKFENYLECIKNIKHLKSFVKLRLSDHNLMIEEGRRKRPMIPRNERLCDT